MTILNNFQVIYLAESMYGQNKHGLINRLKVINEFQDGDSLVIIILRLNLVCKIK